MNSKIIATGSYLPKKVVTNHDLAKMFATSDEWIQKKTGISERRFAAKNEGVSDMALVATREALKQASLQPENLDAIVFATATPDYHAPGSGVLLQHKLSCREIPAFDVRNTSPGFLYSLDLADGLIKTNRYKTVLVVGSEVHSTALDLTDQGRLESVIFGDGAGCVILQATTEEKGIVDILLYSNGAHYDKLWCEGPSSLRNPRVTKEQMDEGIFYPKMDGRFVYQSATQFMSDAVKELLIRNKMNVGDVDLCVCHQANINIIQDVAKRLALSEKRVPTNIHKYGNTSSASIPILLDELNREGKITPGQKIVMTSFGSGFCWGAGLVKI